jgi:Flp pilus assembly protein TadG
MIRSQLRRAASAVEFAFVAPVLMLFVFGLVVGAVGIFRYQEVAALAREGSRYASVHGAKYQQATGNTAATPQDVYNNAILPNAAALDLSKLSYNVTWSPDNRQGSYVSVRVSYQWIPEAFLGGITLSSTSKVRISY